MNARAAEPVAVALVDSAGFILSMSDDVESISGLPAETYAGAHWSECAHPDDLRQVAGVTSDIDELPAGTHRAFRMRYHNSEGGWTPVEVEIVRVLDDRTDGYTAHIRRVGGLADRPDQVELFLRSVIDETLDALLVVATDGTIAWASPSAAPDSWSRPQLTGSTGYDFVHQEDFETLTAAIGDLEQGTDTVHFEVRLRDAGGEWRWTRILATDLRDVEGIEGVALMLSDVHDAAVARLALVDSEERLRQRNELLESLTFSSTTGLFELDSRNGLVSVNRNWVEITGLSEEDALGDGWLSLLDPADAVRFRDRAALTPSRPGLGDPVRLMFHRPDGESRWIDVRSSVLPADDEGVVRRIGGIEDVTAVVEAEEAMRRLASVFDSTDDLVLLTEVSGRPIYANRPVYDFFGPEIPALQDLPELAEVVEEVTLALLPGGSGRWSGEVTLTGIAGESRPLSLEVLGHFDEDGELLYLSTTGRDISERIALQEQLEAQATHDPLTGLPNRTMLFERIHRASQAIGDDPERRMALLFIDLDHFKIINDSLGHSVGDQLLCAIARRVRTVVRPSDLVGRFGGDEFVVLCEDLEEGDAATTVAARIESTLEAPFRVDGHDIHVGVSIGIAFADEHHDAEAVLRDADTAMYRAKSGGRGQWVVFDEDLRRNAVERQRVESDLRSACRDGSLELHYQPIVELATGRIDYLEALVRWRRNGELVSPAGFMTVAEETGLVTRIGEWVMSEAARQVALWQGLNGCEDLGISVNVSAHQLLRGGFVPFVSGVLETSGIAAGTLSVEITETTLLDDEQRAVEILEQLRALGVLLSIDDFGTGYSSLTYLHTLPVDMVKLDQSFVSGLRSDERKRAIVEAVVNLSAALGLDPVAEGVETSDQLGELAALRCRFAQGHLFSRALDARNMGAMLSRGRTIDPASRQEPAHAP